MDQQTDETAPTGIESNNPLMDGSDSATLGFNVAMPEVGQKIGPNRILELIAEGGMANVYKVWHEGLEVVRAIKILKPGFNEEAKQRLQTEAKISAHLHHPNIVEIYGVNFWNDTVPYLEMEFIDGFSLKDLLKHKKQLHFTFALSLGYFVCNALHYAHNQVFTLYGKPYHGVVHRDIKPANILLARNGVIKLADFGIAKPTDISLHTIGQKVMGTFTYLSPEQLNGEALDCRCDIYSLGTVIYEILTGVKTFPQKTMAELVQKKMLNEYRRLGTFDVEIPKHLCSILDKSMELNREKRFVNASLFSTELLELLKKVSQKTPDIIVSEYIKSPEKTPSLNLKKNKRFPVVPLIAIGLVVVIAFALMLLFPNFESNFESIFIPKSKSAPVVPPQNQPSQSKAPSVVNTLTLPTNSESVSQKKDNAISRTAPMPVPVPLPAPHVVEKNKVALPLNSGLLTRGFKEARQKHFKDAIESLEAALNAGVADSMKNIAILKLFECVVELKDTARARLLAQSENVNDGYFYLLCGKTFYFQGNYSKAIEQLEKAQTTPSPSNATSMRDATYLWAKCLDEVYKIKPNSQNKRACLRAWEQFSKAFCSESFGNQSCLYAENRIMFFKD